MYKKKVNILIIGCGKMGKSHIKSFISKKNVNLFLYDKNQDQLIEYKKYKNIKILKTLRLTIKINFCIISTNSKERFKVFKNLAIQKKVDIFLLEKFMFLKKNNYLYAQKKCDLKNIYNNVWGKFMYEQVKKYNLMQFNDVKIFINKGHLLTNLIHFMNFFSYYQRFKKVSKFQLKPIKNHNHDEFKGNIVLDYTNQRVLIRTKKITNNFEILFYSKDKKKVFKIILKNNLKLYFYLNHKLLKVTKFPLASFFSYKIFKKNSLVPNFNEILDDNLNVIEIFNKFISKKKLILIR